MRKLDSIATPATNHDSVSLVATEHPFGELDQIEGCTNPQQNCSVVHPVAPKLPQTQGDMYRVTNKMIHMCTHNKLRVENHP